MKIKCGIAEQLITPELGVPLCGYFNPRPNRGVLDNLYVKVLLFEKDGVIGGIVSYDICYTVAEINDRIIEMLSRQGLNLGGNLIFTAVHTHTGPFVDSCLGLDIDCEQYVGYLVRQSVMAICQAKNNLRECEISVAAAENNPFAFNRRFWMRNGSVQTNPGKLNADIVEPEGPVDREIGLLAVKRDSQLVALLANIVNHSDTISGDLVSADWPGLMQQYIRRKLDVEIPVITILGCAGDINHVDVQSPADCSSYAEARRIGSGYGQIVLSMLGQLQAIKDGEFRVSNVDFPVRGREFTAEELAAAEKVMRETDHTAAAGGDLTSEGIAGGDPLVARFFADSLLKFHAAESGKERHFMLSALKFGTDLAVCSMPGEPFTEFGLEIKCRSKFVRTFIATHAQGRAGYLPLKACFERGGYEILPVSGGGSEIGTGEKMVEEIVKNLNA